MGVASLLEYLLNRRGEIPTRALDPDTRLLNTKAGRIRLCDTGGDAPAILMAPDGPCVIEHHAPIIQAMRADYRVVCFDMPGFGFSRPARSYGFGVTETADAMAEIMDALAIPRTHLAFSCANGFFALNFASRYPGRVDRLVLSQTPSLSSMRAWTSRIVPAPLKVPVLGQATMYALRRRLASDWFDTALARQYPHKDWFVRRARESVDGGGCFCLASLVQGLSGTGERDVGPVHCPVLALFGDRDFSHRRTDFASIREHAPEAELRSLEGRSHFPELEAPEPWLAAVNPFLAG